MFLSGALEGSIIQCPLKSASTDFKCKFLLRTILLLSAYTVTCLHSFFNLFNKLSSPLLKLLDVEVCKQYINVVLLIYHLSDVNAVSCKQALYRLSQLKVRF